LPICWRRTELELAELCVGENFAGNVVTNIARELIVRPNPSVQYCVKDYLLVSGLLSKAIAEPSLPD
jgi:hypothetical protein